MWGKRAVKKIGGLIGGSIRHAGTNKASKSSKSASSKSEVLMEMEKKFAARIYDPIPVVISEGKGCVVKDADGARYLDFLGGYASVNTGHCHPKIVATVQNQVMKLHQVSRAFYNSELPVFAEFITRYFNYDRVIPMNTGVEGGDTAIKMARKWGYLSKGIPENQAIVVFPIGNFWGRSTSAISTSNNPTSFEHYGPYMPGFGLVPYDNVCALEEVFQNKNVCAYMMEPIQGEGGVIVPSDGYLKEVRRLCSKYNVLFIADEVQTGLGRTGALLACDHECVRPDILVLGKGLAGAVTPVPEPQKTPKPSSRNWDKVVSELDDAGEESDLGQLFQKIYSEGSDEVKKAMNKSFLESGGTELNTNWGAVKKDTVSIKPPDGLEWRKWDE